MKNSIFFWPSLLGGIFLDDDFFKKDSYVDTSKLLGFDNDKVEEVEDGYVFDFLTDTDIDPEGIKISVKDGILKVKYDRESENEEIHYSSSRSLPNDADVNTIQASTEGTGVRITVKRVTPKEEPKKSLNIPVKVIKPE